MSTESESLARLDGGYNDHTTFPRAVLDTTSFGVFPAYTVALTGPVRVDELRIENSGATGAVVVGDAASTLLFILHLTASTGVAPVRRTGPMYFPNGIALAQASTTARAIITYVSL